MNAPVPAFAVPKLWEPALDSLLSSAKLHSLAVFLSDGHNQRARIFPPAPLRFRALELTPPERVRVVILGQDPYHGYGQAHGLAFSVPLGVDIPPSLRNVYKELQRDLLIPAPLHGCLEPWARQGVLLLNSILTVEEGKAGSHQGLGWEVMTDALISYIGKMAQPVVFMLWGAHAQKKRALIQNSGHLILEAPHPSPLSAHRGFFGCGHFSQANIFLGDRKIDWTGVDVV